MTQPPSLRVDLYSASGSKLDVPPLLGLDILAHNYTNAVGRMGTFSLSVPAEKAHTAAAGRRVHFYRTGAAEGGRLVFRGVIRGRETGVDRDGRAITVLSGPSIGDQLMGLTTGRGLTFEDASLETVVDTLTADTDFVTGEVETATITARRFDGRFLWDGLAATAQGLNLSLREDILSEPPTIDIGLFGQPSGITLRNVAELGPSLAENRYLRPITGIKVKAQSNDLCNRVYPRGQIQGLSGLTLTLGRISVDSPATVTRLYLSNEIAEIVPTPDASWDDTSPLVVGEILRLRTDLGTSPMEGKQWNPAGGAAPWDGARVQYIYGPLGAQVLGGNVKAQIIARESNADVNSRLQMVIRVVSPDGLASRGTALALGDYGNELNTTDRNVTFPSTALSAVDAQAGDWLVIELGFRHAGVVNPRQSTITIGNDGTADLPEDETTTDTTLNPWIEFSQPLALGIELPSGAAYEVLSDTAPDGSPDYYIEDAESIAVHGVRSREVWFKDIVPLGLTNLDLSNAGVMLLGLAIDYLVKHLQEQVAYEVETVGMVHVNPATGVPYFQVGDTFRVQFSGQVQDATGDFTPYLEVDADLYLVDFTRTFNADGSDTWKLTLSTILRALPTDGETLKAIVTTLGIEERAPLGAFIAGDYPNGNYVQLAPNGLTVVSSQDEPFLRTQNAATDGVTEFSTIATGGYSWLTEIEGGSRTRFFEIDKTVGAGLGTGVNDIFPDGVPVHAIFMVACYNTATGAIIGHIFGSGAVNTLLYAVALVTSASSAVATDPSICLNGSNGLDFNGHATLNTRFFGIALLAYSD